MRREEGWIAPGLYKQLAQWVLLFTCKLPLSFSLISFQHFSLSPGFFYAFTVIFWQFFFSSTSYRFIFFYFFIFFTSQRVCVWSLLLTLLLSLLGIRRPGVFLHLAKLDHMLDLSSKCSEERSFPENSNGLMRLQEWKEWLVSWEYLTPVITEQVEHRIVDNWWCRRNHGKKARTWN